MTTDEELRERAIKRVEDRRGFYAHLAIYLIVNAALFAAWAMSGGGYYWPMWVAFGWGIGILFHAFGVFFADKEPDEETIQREIEKMRGRGVSGPTSTA